MIISIRYYPFNPIPLTAFSQLKSFNSTEQLKVIAQVLCKMGKFFNEMTEQCLMQLSDQQAIKHKHRMLLNRQNLKNFDCNKKLQKMKLKQRSSIEEKALKKIHGIKHIKNHKPKHPVSSFFFFYQDKGQEIAKQTGESQGSKKAKIVGEMWKNMTQEQRQPYQRKAKITRQKYEQEMNRYRIQYADEIARFKRHKKEIKRKKQLEAKQHLQPQKKPQCKTQEDQDEKEFLKLEELRLLKEESKQAQQQDSLDISDALSDSISKSSVLFEETASISSSSQLSAMAELQLQEQNTFSKSFNNQSNITEQKKQNVKVFDIKHTQLKTAISTKREVQNQAKKTHQFLRPQPKLNVFAQKSTDLQKNQQNNMQNQVVSRPKGPISSFLLFYQVKGKQLAQKHNMALGPKVVKIASDVWRSLSPSQKAIYSKMAKQHRQKYLQQMISLKQQYGPDVFEKTRQQKPITKKQTKN